MSLNKIKRFVFSDFRRQFNFLKLALSYFLKNTKSFGYPAKLMIEPANTCNLNCAACPVGNGEIKKTKGKLTFGDFKKIINEAGPYLYQLTLWNWGEPFLNPEIDRMVKYAVRQGIFVITSTNGHFLEGDWPKKIVLSGLDEIIIALDGLSQETLEKYRRGADFEKVVSGIKRLVEEKRKKASLKPVIQLQFIVMKHNQSELGKLKSFGKEIGVNKIVVKSFGANLDINRFKDFEPDKKYSRYKNRMSVKSFCRQLWFSLNINYDGTAVPCCYDPHEKHILGNVFQEGVKKVWQGEKMLEFRRKLINREKIDICRQCAYNSKISRKI